MNKHYLYENLMRDISNTVKKHINESNFANTMAPEIYKFLFGDDSYSWKSVDEILEDDRIMKKVAGYIVEEQVKDLVKYMFTENYKDERGYHAGTRLMQDSLGNARYIDGKDNWWDFSIDGEKIEIKAFQKGKLYSNVHATANQVKYKDDLTFMLVEYVVDNGTIDITGIAFVNGTDIQFDSTYDRIVRNPNIKFYRGEDYDFEDDNI